jgi:(S)-2-hydroxy-acid oxidase
MCIEDAMIAVNSGADAIIVSNNEGKRLDSSPSTISVLKSIVKSVKSFRPQNPIEVYIDSGFHRGTDILKAIAFGADYVFIGEPVVWAMSNGGYEGVKEMMEMVTEELRIAMVLTHCMDVNEVKEEKVIH